MIDGLTPYPAMKDSGVEWLGEVPEHWNVLRLRNLAKISFSNVDKHSRDNEHPVRLCNYLDVYYNERIHSVMNFMKATSTVDEIEQFRLVTGDVIITKDSESWDDIGVPAFVERASHDLICGYHLALLRPIRDKITGEYLYRALTCQGVASQFYVRANGVTRFGLSQTAIKSVWLPIPPLSEQTTVVRFLDHINNWIDRYIRAKEKLISLLEEQKKAIIHEAVTGRIDVRTGRPYSAYKPSGVEWLGEVPAHWRVQRLKTLCSMKSGEAITAMSIDPVGEHPVYGGNGIRGFTNEYTHTGQHVLIGRQGALCGNVHVVGGKFWASEHAVVATIRVGYSLSYVGAVLRVMNLNQYSISAAQPGLSVERVLNLGIPVPAPDEQAMIAENIQQRIAIDEAAIARTRREAILLREYRSRLIADVVTGKLDVREAAKALPGRPDACDAAPESADGHAASEDRRR